MSFVKSLAKLSRKGPVEHVEWLVIGLGNPGGQYAKTRHNVGFMCLNRLAHRYSARFHASSKDRSDIATVSLGGSGVMLAQPQTFMNESGVAAARMAKRLNLPPERVLLIYDDVDLPFATVRIREEGSAGGHRGVQSVIDHLRTSGVPRIRVGVGRGPQGTKDYVLSEFAPDERIALPDLCDRVADMVAAIVEDGVVSAMNRFNGRSAPSNVPAGGSV